MSLTLPLSNLEGLLQLFCPVKWWGKGRADAFLSLQKERTNRLTENHSEALDFQWDVVTD